MASQEQTPAEAASSWDVVIGLEVHVELATRSKIFCGCAVEFGAPANTRVCPVCMGSPGALPALNEAALALAVRAALALSCEVPDVSKFDRKNYFYPDSPKAYQISQYDEPIGQHGELVIDAQAGPQAVRITRVHLEEDAGKLVHLPYGQATLVDLNRVGVPLIEIVTAPDLRSPADARAYVEELRAIMQYCGISECRMEQGSLRCDANVSLRPRGQTALGVKTEIKNMNSFRHIERALEVEIERQRAILDSGGTIRQATLRFDEERGVTVLMREKEDAQDYRYFPDPDLPRIRIPHGYRAAQQEQIPELPRARRQRLVDDLDLPEYDARVLTQSRALADYFEAVLAELGATSAAAKQVSNWIMGELLAYMKAVELDITEVNLAPSQLADLLRRIESGQISAKAGKDVLREMLDTGHGADAIIAARGLGQISDEGLLRQLASEAIEQNPKSVADFHAGKGKALDALVGQVMKATRGQANPQVVSALLRELLAQ